MTYSFMQIQQIHNALIKHISSYKCMTNLDFTLVFFDQLLILEFSNNSAETYENTLLKLEAFSMLVLQKVYLSAICKNLTLPLLQ